MEVSTISARLLASGTGNSGCYFLRCEDCMRRGFVKKHQEFNIESVKFEMPMKYPSGNVY